MSSQRGPMNDAEIIDRVIMAMSKKHNVAIVKSRRRTEARAFLLRVAALIDPHATDATQRIAARKPAR